MTTPAPATIEDVENYDRALGRFISAFADVESALQGAVALISGTDVDVAMELFGGLQVSRCIELVKKLRRAKGHPEDPILDRALTQLKVISETRNAIVHRGANIHAQGFAVTRPGFVPPSRQKRFDASPAILKAMTRDLTTISTAVGRIMLQIAVAAGAPIPVDFVDGFTKGAEAEWRYKKIELSGTD